MTAIMTSNETATLSASERWDSEQWELIKSQIAPECSDGELKLFAQVCSKTGLDPFARQIYAIKRGGKMTIQVSIDGFRLQAARSGMYAGSETFWCGPDGVWTDVWLHPEPPAAAKTLVWKTGSTKPFTAAAGFNSYKQEYNGKLSGLWAKMPDVMIGKASEALALRKAFPAELSGLYATEEMDQVSAPQQSDASFAPKEVAEGLWRDAQSASLTAEDTKAILGAHGVDSFMRIPLDKVKDISSDFRALNRRAVQAEILEG